MELGDAKTIILVDDDLTTNFLNQLFINQIDESVDTHVALNGKEALELLEQIYNEDSSSNPLLMLLDLYMPEMGGLEFLKVFNERFDAAFKRRINIVVVSALNNLHDEINVKQDPNVQRVVRKPLSETDFNNFVNEYLSSDNQ